MKQNIYIGSDHNGFELKNYIKEYLEQEHEVVDCGPIDLDREDDYPDFAARVAIRVQKDEGSKGILICRNGVGVCIVANKLDGIRAVRSNSIDIVKSSRKDDDTNILCLGSIEIKKEDSINLIDTWLNTKFSGAERHVRRLNKIHRIENDN